MAIQITTTKGIVEQYLRKFPELRENDDKLIANIWKKEMMELGDCVTALDFLKSFSAGKFTSPESIRRSRQKLQANNIELQGPNYHDRKKHEDQIKAELRD